MTRRRAGVLLHPTSLPKGVLGIDAYRFIDFLAKAGFGIWQVLPLGPTHADRSPYQSLSVHAGNPVLIDWHYLIARDWLQESDLKKGGHQRLMTALTRFRKKNAAQEQQEFEAFKTEQQYWLPDYALFQLLKEQHHGQGWVDWPADLRHYRPAALKKIREQFGDELEAICFEQFVFFQQWLAIRQYATERDILIFGDLPIFVAHDSADVWANQDLFLLDKEGHPTVVAGVPPDYFSETGQRWGNPLYDWPALKKQDYRWWKQRMRTKLQLFDVVRIDHFRGFEAYWEIDAQEQTAVNGQWQPGPGEAFFHTLQHEFGKQLPLVAEDLGVITDEVDALRDQFSLPGMKILQFAFGGGADNPYLPHNHITNCVVYTGTHDNNTTLGWYQETPKEVHIHMHDYFGGSEEPMPWPLVRAALSSTARWAVLPMQDVLCLDGQHRMNVPGTQEGNWQWRFSWGQCDEGLEEKFSEMNALYGRV